MADTYTTNLGLTKPGYDSMADIAVINANMDKIDAAYKTVDAAKLGGRPAEAYSAVNLLDNSNFLNPINQRGFASNKVSGEYTIDRWKNESGNHITGTVMLNSNGITLAPTTENYCGIIQNLEHYSALAGKTCTVAVCVGDVWSVGSFKMGAISAAGLSLGNGLYVYSSSTVHLRIRNPAGGSAITIQRVALYEGAYTAETLPPYVPKPYVTELAECQRYYVRFNADVNLQFATGGSNSASVYAPVHLAVPLRSNIISIEYSNVNIYPYTAGKSIEVTSLAYEAVASSCNVVVLQANYASTSDLTYREPASIRILAGGYIAFSAEL